MTDDLDRRYRDSSGTFTPRQVLDRLRSQWQRHAFPLARFPWLRRALPAALREFG